MPVAGGGREATMSVRRVRGSFRGSLRQYVSGETAKRNPVRHFQWVYQNDEWHIAYDDGDEVSLMFAKFERLPMKDFGAEVRASMDVDQFLIQAVLLLDVQETSLEGIVDKMLQKGTWKYAAADDDFDHGAAAGHDDEDFNLRSVSKHHVLCAVAATQTGMLEIVVFS
ncbi:hypothetical protein HPB49_008212 [Dermacentor silvarum]|uniref:Uncharacterized protein n=1 Tax=Dermacentor silvarum TaxID=543639 RepID=A0ACB8DIT7_DERSI|nr:hypothetical protein HPB49_008212 [Dermacentor silvarum]